MHPGRLRVTRSLGHGGIPRGGIPGILAGAVFAFVHSWDELVVLLFITSRKLYLLPRAIWAGIAVPAE